MALNSFSERTPSAAIMETYVCRGAASGRAGNVHSAIDDFTKAIQIDPQSENAIYNRGVAREQLGQYGLAIEDFGRSIDLSPTDKRSYIRRGVCRKRLNDVLGARRDFAEARQLITAEKPKYRTIGEKPPSRLIDAPMRFPPPPGTRFYVCFRVNGYEPFPPYEEMLTVVADHPDEAIDQVLRDGPALDPSRRYVTAIWFNHNGRARSCVAWLSPDDKAGN